MRTGPIFHNLFLPLVWKSGGDFIDAESLSQAQFDQLRHRNGFATVVANQQLANPLLATAGTRLLAYYENGQESMQIIDGKQHTIIYCNKGLEGQVIGINETAFNIQAARRAIFESQILQVSLQTDDQGSISLPFNLAYSDAELIRDFVFALYGQHVGQCTLLGVRAMVTPGIASLAGKVGLDTVVQLLGDSTHGPFKEMVRQAQVVVYFGADKLPDARVFDLAEGRATTIWQPETAVLELLDCGCGSALLDAAAVMYAIKKANFPPSLGDRVGRAYLLSPIPICNDCGAGNIPVPLEAYPHV
ncbi:MAG: hypothetical protein ABIG95_03245 [Candidatus Woesearchaeota archaeon]